MKKSQLRRIIREEIKKVNESDELNPELIDAVESGDLSTIKKKLKSKDIDLRDDWGNTLLALAAIEDQFDIIKYLLKKGADINTVNRYGGGWIDFAKKHGSSKTKKFIDKNYI